MILYAPIYCIMAITTYLVAKRNEINRTYSFREECLHVFNLLPRIKTPLIINYEKSFFLLVCRR